MIRTLMFAAVSAAVLAFSPTAFAQSGGTAAEAKAMLMKAAAAVKADQTKALERCSSKGEGGFLDRDLYVFCGQISDGKAVATRATLTASKCWVRTPGLSRTPRAKNFGVELYAAYQKPEGEITEVNYMFPSPTSKTPVAKVSLVTRVSADLGCGVGYYRSRNYWGAFSCCSSCRSPSND